MTKFVAGLLIGFFVAVGLMAGFVQVYMGPNYETIKTAQPYAQTVYNLAHSGTYGQTQAFVAKINEAAASVAQIPMLGSMVDTAKVSQYAQMAVDALQNAKASSEVTLQLISTSLMLIEAALPLFLLSLIMIGVGYWMYTEEEKGAKKKGKK